MKTKSLLRALVLSSAATLFFTSAIPSLPSQGTEGDMVPLYKYNTDTPICVGFGISSVETAGAVKEYCDGVIIGSAIVRRIGEEKEFEERKKDVYKFVKKIKDNL